jgi:membrane associated rhomboid family serine protease
MLAPPTPSTRALLLLLGVFFFAQSKLGGWQTDDPLALYRLGSLWAPAVLDGDWWRVGSYAFLHIGPVHFLMNAWALWILMRPLEAMFGPAVPIGLFAAASIAGGAASCAWALSQGNVLVSAAGASGGLFGLFGAELALWVRLRKLLPPEVARGALRAMAVNIVINVLIALSFPVDSAAHLGGLAMGLLLTLLIPIRNTPLLPWQTPARLLVIACAFVLFAMEGAAVARAVKPRDRQMKGDGFSLSLPSIMVPLGPTEAASTGTLGLVLTVTREGLSAAGVPGKAPPEWQRIRSSDRAKAPLAITLTRFDRDVLWVLELVCARPECLSLLDPIADQLAGTFTAP